MAKKDLSPDIIRKVSHLQKVFNSESQVRNARIRRNIAELNDYVSQDGLIGGGGTQIIRALKTVASDFAAYNEKSESVNTFTDSKIRQLEDTIVNAQTGADAVTSKAATRPLKK